MRSEIERFHLVLSDINQKPLTGHVIVTCLKGKRKKNSPRRKDQIDYF